MNTICKHTRELLLWEKSTKKGNDSTNGRWNGVHGGAEIGCSRRLPVDSNIVDWLKKSFSKDQRWVKTLYKRSILVLERICRVTKFLIRNPFTEILFSGSPQGQREDTHPNWKSGQTVWYIESKKRIFKKLPLNVNDQFKKKWEVLMNDKRMKFVKEKTTKMPLDCPINYQFRTLKTN